LQMVETGMPARVRVEAIHNSEFTGTVSDIAVMPNQETEWTNPNLKVFDVEVELNSNDERLRTGMSCLVEIIVHRYRDVHYVPVQAVAKRQGQPFVYVRNGNDLEERNVEVGLSDNRMTAILSGLEEGEEVLLSPPFSTDAEEDETGEVDEAPAPGADPLENVLPRDRDAGAGDAYSDET
jgi:HlyD family secretion protein